MSQKTTSAQNLLAIAISVPLFSLVGYVILNVLIYYVIGFLTGSSALDDLMVGYTYLIMSVLLGCTFTILYWRKVAMLIATRGIPGVVHADESIEVPKKPTTKIAVSLFVNYRRKQGSMKVFAGTFPMERIEELFSGADRPKVTLRTPRGVKLVIAREDAFRLSENLDTGCLFFKMIRSTKKVLYHFQTVPGSSYVWNNNAETGIATCTYNLVHLGCEDEKVAAVIKFSGKTSDIRKLLS